MNIAQINQHQNSQAPKEPRLAEVDASLLNAFKGQLQFAENGLELISTQSAKGENPRDYHEEIEQKRKDEDLESSIAMSYLNDQKQENRFEKSMLAQSQLDDAQTISSREKEHARRQVVGDATDTKKLNQQMGKDRILQQKPYVVSSGLQSEGSEAPKHEFAELLQAKHDTPDQNQGQKANKAALANFPIPAENPGQMHNQGQTRMERNATLTKPAMENGAALKATTLQTDSQKSSSNADYHLNKRDTLTTGKEGKSSPIKNDGFANELNTSTKASEKMETATVSKQTQTEEPKQPNAKNVVDNVKIMLSSGRESIVMRLNPEHLGKLEIKLKKTGDVLTGEFKVESVEAKKLLMAEFSQLQKNLESHGIKLEHFSVYIRGEENKSLALNSAQDRQQQEPSSEQKEAQLTINRKDTGSLRPSVKHQKKTDSAVNIVI